MDRRLTGERKVRARNRPDFFAVRVYKVCTLMYYKGMPDTRIVVTVKTKRGVDETGALIGLQSAFAKFGEWTYEFETWTRNGRVYGSFWSERVPVEELMATLMELKPVRSWKIER